MKEPYEAYIKVKVLPDTLDEDGFVKMLTPGGMVAHALLAEIVMAPDIRKGGSIASAEELAALGRELDEARAARAEALNEISYWRSRAQENRDELQYLRGVVDAAKSLSDLNLPVRDLCCLSAGL